MFSCMSPFATNPGDETMTVTIAPSGGTTKSFRPHDDPSLGPRVIATMRLSGPSVSTRSSIWACKCRAGVRLAQSRHGTFPGPRGGGSGQSPVPPPQTPSPRSSSPPALYGTGRYADPSSVRAIPRSRAAAMRGRNSAAGMIE